MATPEELSPVPAPTPAGDAELPFGLTWHDLADVLPGSDGSARARVSHRKQGRHQGGHPSVIMTLSRSDDHGARHERTVFFKQNDVNGNDAAAREAGAYRYLGARGVSIPQLLLAVDRGDGEVLGLEFLPSIGIGPADVDEVLPLIGALNALGDPPAEIAALPGGLPQSEFERRVADALDAVADRWPELEPVAWLEAYRVLRRAYRQLPRALTHGELAPQQFGRTEDGRLVVFDLATLGLRPRLADLANLLPDLIRLSGDDERSILERYLSGPGEPPGPADVDRVRQELRLTRFVQSVEALPWQIAVDDGRTLHDHVMVVAADHAALTAVG